MFFAKIDKNNKVVSIVKCDVVQPEMIKSPDDAPLEIGMLYDSKTGEFLPAPESKLKE